MKRHLSAIFVLCALFGTETQAFFEPDLTQLNNLTNEVSGNLLRTIAIGADHRAYMPASPMGLAIGIDFGVDVTAISLPSEFTTALTLVSAVPVGDIPSVIPVPKFSFHKGLPFGIDLGFTYATSKMLLGKPDLFSLWGLDAKWAFMAGGGVTPAVAVRASYSGTDIWFMHTRTFAFDVLASKNLYIIDPYLGAGVKVWSGDLSLPAGALPLPDFTNSASAVNPHIFAGLPIKMTFMRLTAEVDYNFAGVTTYGAKASLGF